MSDTENLKGYERPTHGPRPTKIANPGALGLFSFASTTFILSLYNVNARHITTPNVVLGMAVFCGGLAQLLAGMWEFPRGNVFGATAFTSYGAFWMSYAVILIPGFGVASAYSSTEEFEQAIGIYLVTWFVLTVMLLIGALRRNIGFIALLFFLAITFLLLGIGAWTSKAAISKAGGGFGILTAWIAYYCGLSELLVKD
ncbi:Gpr1 family protein [Pisolithus sp. B1]|nr:Gpr1 family protein [Pisolithus sp. B1]